MKKVLAINGSTRRQSTNLSLINAIKKLAEGKLDIELYDGLVTLPHFNPDDDNETVFSQHVTDFRNKVTKADGVLICTPEYAMGVPGTLKNALDWCVSSSTFSSKPTVLITASSMGEKGHASLLDTLRIIEAVVPDELQLHIPFAKTKIDSNVITDLQTLTEVQAVLKSLLTLIDVN